MTESEKMFCRVIKELPHAIEGKMFGAKSIKSSNGKTAAFFWKGDMVFKLDKEVKKEALKLDGAKIGTHLYAPQRQMKGWVKIPAKHGDKWTVFAKSAIEYVERLR